jgi:ribosomal protein L16 Arg81 hydroxylase
MISTLQGLIAPSTQSEFLALLRDRKVSLRRAGGESRYLGLADWATVRGAVESGTVPLKMVRVSRNGHNLARLMYADNDKVNASRFASFIPQGVSVVVNQLEQYVSPVGALCADIAARLYDPVTVIAVTTTGPGGAFKLHYDTGDVLVLQIEGSKRWRIYAPPVAYPVKGMAKSAPPDTPPIFDEMLHAGDFLVLPSGYWHHCDNGSDLSLHLSFLIQPRNALHALQALEQQLTAEPDFRAPLMRMGGDERAAHEAALKARLIELIERNSLGDMGAKFEVAKPGPDDEW